MGAYDYFKQQYGVEARGYAVYDVQLQLRDLIVGGVPSDPDIIKGWLRSRLEVDDAHLNELAERVREERFAQKEPTTEELVQAIAGTDLVNINGFVRDDNGQLCYEGRCMKAALREAANSAFPGTDYFGKSDAPMVSQRKGLMSTMVERIFVPERLIGLGVKSDEVSSNKGEGAAWIEDRIKHVPDRKNGGTMGVIARVEVVKRPLISFTVRVHDDFLSMESWARIWGRLEDIGIGSDKARSDGMVDLVKFERIEEATEVKSAKTAPKATTTKAKATASK